MSYDVFISYASIDFAIAKSVVDFLESNGINCFISNRNIPAGTEWAPYIINAMEQSKVMVVIFSESYNKSVQVDREITLCCDVEKKPIIPFLVSNAPFHGTKKFYFSNLNWIQAYPTPSESYGKLLSSIKEKISIEESLCRTFTRETVDIQLESYSFKCYIGHNVTEAMIREAVEIDKLVYKSDYIGDYETCVNWWKKNPQIYIMLEDPQIKRIIGYINAMPINENLYEKIMSGKFIDITIQSTDIETYDLPDYYKLYIPSVAIHPNYHNTGAFKSLYDAFLLLLVQLFKQETYFSQILADAVTPAGEKLCKYIGMSLLKETEHFSKIYEGKLIPPSIRSTTALSKNIIAMYKSLNLNL